MDRRALLAGVLAALPFTVSVALVCTTSLNDPLYRSLSVAGMFGVYLALAAVQVAIGVTGYRGVPFARPLATVTGAFMLGVVAVLLAGDVAVRIAKPGFLPPDPVGTAILWAQLLAPMLALAALSAVAVAIGVWSARRAAARRASCNPSAGAA